MIEFSFRGKKKFAVDFTFFAAIALFFYFDESGFGIMGICACAIHEIGHLIALFIEKRDFDSVLLYGGGVKIKFKKNLESSVFLIIAGSLLNFIIFTVLYFTFSEIFELQILAITNLIIGIFNLLPVRYFDGGNLLEKVLIKIFPTQNVLMILRKTEIITAFFTIVLIIVTACLKYINLSALIVIMYIIILDFTVKIK
ncbi:MAG: site-2 protease family protein [Oscillospiraceae bacterium]|nr:site-2 protease family protein [Oscillospiraceae bacterium]